jgi:hypothetical protein
MSWDLSEVKGFEILPEGKYPAKISKVEFKESKSGSEYLNLAFETGKGNVSAILNINHPNEQPRNIALAELKRLLSAAGFTEFKFNSKEALAEALYTVKCEITVKHKTDDYGTKPVIKGYSMIKDEPNTGSIPF